MVIQQVIETKQRPVSDRIYDALTLRLARFTKKMTEEEQTEIDGVIAIFSDDVANAVRTVTFFNLK